MYSDTVYIEAEEKMNVISPSTANVGRMRYSTGRENNLVRMKRATTVPHAAGSDDDWNATKHAMSKNSSGMTYTMVKVIT